MTNIIDRAAGASARRRPDFRAGDTLKVHVGRRGQPLPCPGLPGRLLRLQGSGVGRTFTVRKVCFGVGVERPSRCTRPIIDKIEIVTRGDVRRAKLYYLRNLRGRPPRSRRARGLSAPGVGALLSSDERGRAGSDRPTTTPRKERAQVDAPVAGDDPAARSRARDGADHQDLLRPGLLHPVAVDGATMLVDDRILVQKVSYWGGAARARRHRRVRGPGRLAGRGGLPPRPQPVTSCTREDRAVPDRRPPREARHRRRRRPRRVLRREGASRSTARRWTRSPTCPRTRPLQIKFDRKVPRTTCG